jgi:hypothetical protein
MKTEMILAGTQFVAMVLSFTLLLGARRLSVGLWSQDLLTSDYPRGATWSKLQNSTGTSERKKGRLSNAKHCNTSGI